MCFVDSKREVEGFYEPSRIWVRRLQSKGSGGLGSDSRVVELSTGKIIYTNAVITLDSIVTALLPHPPESE